MSEYIIAKINYKEYMIDKARFERLKKEEEDKRRNGIYSEWKFKEPKLHEYLYVDPPQQGWCILL